MVASSPSSFRRPKYSSHIARKAGIAVAARPCERAVFRKIKGDAQVRMYIVRQGKFGRIGNGVIDGSVGHAIQQCLGTGAGIFDPDQLRIGIASIFQSFRMRTARRNLKVGIANFEQRTRSWRAATIDQVFAYALIGRARTARREPLAWVPSTPPRPGVPDRKSALHKFRHRFAWA